LYGLVGRPAESGARKASGIQWGGDAPIASAKIEDVEVACYSEVEGPQGDQFHPAYCVAATARLTRAIVDTTRFEFRSGSFSGYSPRIKFQLVFSPRARVA